METSASQSAEVSESALSEGTPPIGPWRGVCVSACDIPGALRSRPSVRMESISGSVMTSSTSGLYEPPHDNPSSLAGEGFNSSSRKRARCEMSPWQSERAN
eukprot:scaffold4484_cov98-Isochrysis_galbana.AAC.1